MPKVSVIIPVYNVEKYLRESLDSIVNQTYKNIEIICIDDGSTDTSLEIIEEYAFADNRFIVLRQQNKGAACARNYGMSIAKGKYLLFLDSDDIFHKQMVGQTVEKAEQYDADIVIYKATSFHTVTGRQALLNDNISNFPQYYDKVFSMDDVPDVIFNSFLVSAWNKLFKRDFIKNNGIKFQDIKRTNDLFFTNKALVLAERIILLNEPLLFYRVGIKNNLQDGNDKTPLAFYEALYKLKRFLESEKLYAKLQRSFLNLALEVIFYNINSMKTNRARGLVIDSLKKYGFERLGISTCQELREINFLGYLQYKAFMLSESKKVSRGLYCWYKFVWYCKLVGIRNAITKVLVKW